LQLTGWVGLPTFSRSQQDMQFFYVNGRLIRDKLVSHAVKQAYQDVLFHGRHPVFVLYLTLDLLWLMSMRILQNWKSDLEKAALFMISCLQPCTVHWPI